MSCEAGPASESFISAGPGLLTHSNFPMNAEIALLSFRTQVLQKPSKRACRRIAILIKAALYEETVSRTHAGYPCRSLWSWTYITWKVVIQLACYTHK